MRRSQVVGIVLLVLPLAGWSIAPRIALASWLAAWWWALGVVLGCFVNAWMHALTGGAWGLPVRAAAVVMARRMPILLLGIAFVLLAMRPLYPWARGDVHSAFAQVWFEPGFFIARLIFYGVVWWWLARAATLATKGRAAASMIVYAAVMSLAAVDILMSLMPQWYSTAFGLIAMSSQALAGAAAVVLIAPLPTDSKPPISRDLGNLLLMWCMTWGYLAFMQFLIIWAENLPREIAWYVPRLQTGWRWIGLALVLLQLVIPFVALLFRDVKDRPRRLRAVAALLLASSALDTAWLVLPSIDAHDANAWWMLPLAMAGSALLLFAGTEAPQARLDRSLGHA